MQSRLTRSRTDVIIAGVCGGLGEYFTIDPIVARLILVLITLQPQFFGIGIPLYILLWVLIPKGSTSTSDEESPAPPHNAQSQSSPQAAPHVSQRVASSAHHAQQQTPPVSGIHTQAPPPEAYRFDPQTGKPIGNANPAIGETINLGNGAFAHIFGAQPSANTNPPQSTPDAKHPRQKKWRKIGIVLIGMGVIILLNQLGIPMWFMMSALMISGGFLLMRRGR